MDPQVCFYLPVLHSESIPEGLFPHVLALPCERALYGPRQHTARADAQLTETQRAALTAFCDALPLSPPEARATLEEMMRLGETTTDNVFLARIRQNEADAQAAEQREQHDIERFSGAPLPPADEVANDTAERQRRARIDSQKILLLAYELEAHTRAIAQLEQTIARAGRSLQAHLADGDASENDEILPLESTAPLASGPDAGISWRLILEAALAFAPATSVFYTQDPRMAADLAALGPLQPLTAEEAAQSACFGLPSSGLRSIRLSGWQLAGRRTEDAYRPWLSAPVTIFITAAADLVDNTVGGSA